MSALTFLIVAVIKIVVTLGVLLTVVAYTVWLERKVVGRMQNRWGPSRVGPFGLLQPLADGIKFLLKEDLTPPYVEKHIYLLAPGLALIMALTSIALVPIGPVIHLFGISTPVQITGVVDSAGHASDINIGILVILGLTSLGVYGIALAGWSSNSKYSLLGSLRASAQMISYEVSLGLSLVGVLIMSGTMSLNGIVHAQLGTFFQGTGFGFIPRWNIFQGQFVAFFLYMIAAFAETNRIPFDMPEAETELVAGYHTEYSAMKFAMFFMAEYANMVTVACIASVMFLGGWSGPPLPFLPAAVQAFLPLVWFSSKIFFFLFLYIWIRGTLPRFRYDQLMSFGWKFLFPLALANVIVTAFIVAIRA